MKKFSFPLRPVATVRTIQEIRARESFSKAVHTYVTAEQALKTLRDRITELEEIIRSGRLTHFRPTDQASFHAAFQDEVRQLTHAQADVAAARAAMEAARQAWLISRRDLRIIENLETKARVSHRREVERENQAAMDDRASALASRMGLNPQVS